MTIRYTMEPLPDYGTNIPMEDFINAVVAGGFIDYDGSGNLSTETLMSDISVKPSSICLDHDLYPEFTHVMWFNR